MNHRCYICYGSTDDYMICDRCEEHYCDDCSYTFTIHYQYQGSLCYNCSDQSRRKKLTRDIIRDNKIKSLFVAITPNKT